jgi:hypothetical protein
MAGTMAWTSTFAIHAEADRERAIDNARRFVRFGGQLNYGTDMGNGPMPVGPRPEEITAMGETGLAGDALLASMTGPPGDGLKAAGAVYAPLPVPDGPAELAVWMNQARQLAGVLKEGAIA